MKRKTIALEKLATESAKDLDIMVAELSGDSSDRETPHWSTRFAASGKGTCSVAPKIRAD